ncbi:MAG: TIGR00282 family metallophosphoesterase [Candidatus Omnitrophica bacterium]|nr:TIGR00282 family metallophosphoesterase [Candidatus Omnitrophota bacterium]MCG2704496.1 TIGR00282 family metallophosphoesterase [Candidatus Omnitrophota bacterium]
MKILFIGDIVGSPGRRAIKELVPKITKKEKIDFVVANAENAAGGSGVTPNIAEELFSYGVDVITSGDHIWKKKEIVEFLDAESKLLRPANYPAGAPGSGWGIYSAKNGAKVGIINLVGRVFMEAVECPFKTGRDIVEKIRKETPIILIDMHAEATSEKIALGWYLDGEVSAILGTHTHVQTADERIYPKGTAFISDLGMTGPHDSVIGRKVEQILTRFLTSLPTRFEMAEDNVQLNGVVVTIDEKTGKALEIKRINEKLGG